MAPHSVHGVSVALVDDINSAQHDALVVLIGDGVPHLAALDDFLTAARDLDCALRDGTTPALVACPRVAGRRLVLAPLGPLTPYDDVRSVAEAASAGVARALAAGARAPVIALQPNERWPRAELVALLAALERLYVPLQVRESFPAQALGVRALGVYCEGVRAPVAELVREAVALEMARGVARDVGGADPERMAPMRVAQYAREVFAGSAVTVRVLDDADEIDKRYPLLAAVDRAARAVPRHRGCVVFLEYAPEAYEKTYMFVGKGVTYDTGGCDVKAGGAMAGMSRDKCGAAAILGFFKACCELRPRLKALAALGLVRNSIGECGYVADELLRSRRGLAVRVGNTDAEGRMVMADLLDEMRELADREPSPHLFTVATLTGHAHRAYGDGYTAALDNHAARGTAEKLRAAGDRLGDMLEVSTVRREDLATHRGRAPGDQVHQADNCASTASPRGHQAPAAFLLLVSGLDAGSVPFTHLDIAASAGSLPSPPTAAPLLALAAYCGLLRAA